MTALEISFFPFILPTIVGIIFCIYFVLYKITINKALNEENGRHIRMPSIGSMGSSLLTICLIIFLIANYVKLSNLQDDIYNLEQNCLNKISLLQTNITTLEDEIEDANSLIQSFESSIKDFDLDKHTLELSFEVIPKNHNDDTKISLTLNSYIVDLEKNTSNKFTGSLTVDMFGNEYLETIITISDGNIKKTEQLSAIDTTCIWQKFLPSFNAIFSNGEHFEYADNNFHLDGSIDISTYNNEDSNFVNGKVVIEVNGRLVDTIDMSIDNNIFSKTIELDKKISMGKTDLLEVYVVADDSLGYTHKYYVFGWSDGATNAIWNGEQEKIYDKDGTLLTK